MIRLAILVWLLLACGVTPAAPRVALVATERGEVVQQVLALAEARLGEQGGIEVLERRQIDRLLAEKKLTLSGLVAGDQALAVGKLLAVDLFAVLESAPTACGC